jgi:hypothetical protein
MGTIEVPVAALPKLVAVPTCALIVAAVLWWAVPKFRLYLRIMTGRDPRKPGTRTIQPVLGFLSTPSSSPQP